MSGLDRLPTDDDAVPETKKAICFSKAALSDKYNVGHHHRNVTLGWSSVGTLLSLVVCELC